MKNTLLWILDAFGINALFRRLHQNKAIILMYHGISDDHFTLLKGYDDRHIPTSSFKKQVKYLKKKGYIFTNMSDLVCAIKKKENLARYVALTFDDGLLNVIENAYPIMQEFDAKGCYYLVSDLIGSNQLLWTDFVETAIRNQKNGVFHFTFKGADYRYNLDRSNDLEFAMKDVKTKLRSLPDKERLEHLDQFGEVDLSSIPKEFKISTWEQIRELDPELMEIGCHTKTHPNCDRLTSDSELEKELVLSKRDIEYFNENHIIHFCYPAGAYNDTVIEKIKQSEYESAVTTEYGFVDTNSALFKLKRIDPSDNFLLFKARISGTIGFLHIMKSLKRAMIK